MYAYLILIINYCDSFFFTSSMTFPTPWPLTPVCLGSPFFCAVADGTRATLSGEGLHMIPVHHATSFRVDINDAGDADLDVKITGKISVVCVSLFCAIPVTCSEWPPRWWGQCHVSLGSMSLVTYLSLVSLKDDIKGVVPVADVSTYHVIDKISVKCVTKYYVSLVTSLLSYQWYCHWWQYHWYVRCHVCH